MSDLASVGAVVIIVGLICLVVILTVLVTLLRNAQVLTIEEGVPMEGTLDTPQSRRDRDARIVGRAKDIQGIADQGIKRYEAKVVIEAADAIIREARLDLTAEDNTWLNTVLCERPSEGQHAIETPFSLGMIRRQFPSQRAIMVTVLVVVVLQAITLLATLLG